MNVPTRKPRKDQLAAIAAASTRRTHDPLEGYRLTAKQKVAWKIAEEKARVKVR